jgi:hypothetical protein
MMASMAGMARSPVDCPDLTATLGPLRRAVAASLDDTAREPLGLINRWQSIARGNSSG